MLLSVEMLQDNINNAGHCSAVVCKSQETGQYHCWGTHGLGTLSLIVGK